MAETDPSVTLKAWIREIAPGSCKMLSLGVACTCPLCLVDQIFAALRSCEARITELQAQVHHYEVEKILAIGIADELASLTRQMVSWAECDIGSHPDAPTDGFRLRLEKATRAHEVALSTLQANEAAEARIIDLEQQLTEQRVIGHGEGQEHIPAFDWRPMEFRSGLVRGHKSQEHTIADVNAGRIDDLIRPRLLAARDHQTTALRALVEKWIARAEDKQLHLSAWATIVQCAQELQAALAAPGPEPGAEKTD